MQPVIFIRSSGSVYFPDLPNPTGKRRGPTVHSDIGEVAAALKYLHENSARLGIDLVFYGRPTWKPGKDDIVASDPDPSYGNESAFDDPLPGLKIVEPRPLPKRSVAGLLDEEWHNAWMHAESLRLMTQFNLGQQPLILDFSGTTIGWSWSRQECFWQPRDDAARGSSVMLWLCEHYNCRRASVMCDATRCYPSNPEMESHPKTRPIALLSFQDKESQRGKYKFIERDCGIANWFTDVRVMPGPEVHTKLNDFIMVANCHLDMGYRQKKTRAPIYSALRLDELVQHEGCLVYGAGWSDCEKYCDYVWDRCPVEAPQSSVPGLLALGRSGLVLAPEPERQIITPPMRFYAWCGSAPLLWGRGPEKHTFDREGRAVPLDSPFRVTDYESLVDAINYVKKYPMEATLYRGHVLESTRPNYAKLDALLSEWACDQGASAGLGQPGDSGWTHMFGGVYGI